MKKIKNNKVIDLRNKSENEKVREFGKISKKINSLFDENNKNQELVLKGDIKTLNEK